MTVNKLTLPAKDNAVQSKVNDIVDELGNKLENIATGSYSITIGSNPNAGQFGVNVGYSASGTSYSAAFGSYTEASNSHSTAIGTSAVSTANSAIQIGKGTNSSANTLSIGFNNANANYELLDGTTGLIPDDRISTNIARASQIPSISNLANKDLSNLSATGQAVIDGKADTSFSNITNTAKIAIAHNAMPSNTYTDLTLGASGSTYTALADGYYVVSINMTGAYSSMFLLVNGSYRYSTYCAGALTIGNTVPVKKNDVLTVNYFVESGTPTKNEFRFYYAVGSESEVS